MSVKCTPIEYNVHCDICCAGTVYPGLTVLGGVVKAVALTTGASVVLSVGAILRVYLY